MPHSISKTLYSHPLLGARTAPVEAAKHAVQGRLDIDMEEGAVDTIERDEPASCIGGRHWGSRLDSRSCLDVNFLGLGIGNSSGEDGSGAIRCGNADER